LFYFFFFFHVIRTEKKARKKLSQGSRRVPVGTMKTEYIEQNIHNRTYRTEHTEQNIQITRSLKRNHRRKSMYAAIFVTKHLTFRNVRRLHFKTNDKAPVVPPPLLLSLAVKRGKIRDNCSVLRVGTLDSSLFNCFSV
jgi:hypothetical protein